MPEMPTYQGFSGFFISFFAASLHVQKLNSFIVLPYLRAESVLLAGK